MDNIQHKYIAAWDELTHVRPERRVINQQKAVELHAPKKAIFLMLDNKWMTYDELSSEDNKQQLMKIYKKMFNEDDLETSD